MRFVETNTKNEVLSSTQSVGSVKEEESSRNLEESKKNRVYVLDSINDIERSIPHEVINEWVYEAFNWSDSLPALAVALIWVVNLEVF